VSGNKRVFYACLGVAPCGGSGLTGVVSGSLSFERPYRNIFTRANRNPIATWGEIPNVSFSYTKYLDSFVAFANEDGINNFVGFDLIVGDDTQPNLTSSIHGARCSLALLESVTYNLPVDGSFTVERKYKGSSKPLYQGTQSVAAAKASVKRRQCYTSGLPTKLKNNAIQNITISFSINRSAIEQFATRKPYAYVVNWPIETNVTFEMLNQYGEDYAADANIDACKNPTSNKENITISLSGGGGSITIPNAYLTNLTYSGGEANSNSNQTISASFTSFDVVNSSSINPVIITPEPDEDPCAE
jgi:hypothetical protein